MKKSREEYSEDLESYYRRIERISEEIIKNFESEIHSKNSEALLDSVHNFFVQCYHLREWVNKDTKVSQEVKSKIPSFEGADSPVQFLICRDLCNKSKHAILQEKYKPNDENTRIVKTGGSIFSVSSKEFEEARKKRETIHLKTEDEIFLGNFIVPFKGKNYELKGLIQGCMHVWRKFFEENDLLLPRTTSYG